MENIERLVYRLTVFDIVSYIALIIIGVVIVLNIASNFDRMQKNYIRLYEMVEDIKNEQRYGYDSNRDRIIELKEQLEEYYRKYYTEKEDLAGACSKCGNKETDRVDYPCNVCSHNYVDKSTKEVK